MIVTVIIIVRCFSYLMFYLNNQTVSQLITQTSFHFLLFLIFSFLRASASVDAKNLSILQKKNLLFLFCTPIFTKLPHQFFYYIHLFNKIFFFSHYHLYHRPNTTHTATIIQPPNHHHQATRQPSHHPIQPSYHQ